MPIFEYICQNCGKKEEHFIRNSSETVTCACGSKDLKRVFSSFAVSEGSDSFSGGCSDGSCHIPKSPCASGMCGL